jgi:hypothetical protein
VPSLNSRVKVIAMVPGRAPATVPLMRVPSEKRPTKVLPLWLSMRKVETTKFVLTVYVPRIDSVRRSAAASS